MINANQDYSTVINILSNLNGVIQQECISLSHTCPTWSIREIRKGTLLHIAMLGLKLKRVLLYGKLLVTLTVVGTPGRSFVSVASFGQDDKCHFYL